MKNLPILRGIVLCLSCLLLEGCASHWARPDTTQKEFMKDVYQCMQENQHESAQASRYGASAQFSSGTVPSCDGMRTCMMARGYQRTSDGDFTARVKCN